MAAEVEELKLGRWERAERGRDGDTWLTVWCPHCEVWAELHENNRQADIVCGFCRGLFRIDAEGSL